MRKFYLLLAVLALCFTPAISHAVGSEVSVGAVYAPITEQDHDQLYSAFGMYFAIAARASEHVTMDLAGGYMRASDVLGGKSQLYTIGLGAKYFFNKTYIKNADGTSTENFVRVNPFFRTSIGAADGEIVGDDINTFLSFINGGGIRWDPTENTRDWMIDLDARMVTGTGSDGQAQTNIGVYGAVTLETDFGK